MDDKQELYLLAREVLQDLSVGMPDLGAIRRDLLSESEGKAYDLARAAVRYVQEPETPSAQAMETLRAVTKRQQDDARAIERLTQSLGWALNRLEYGPALEGDDHDNEQLRRARVIQKQAATTGNVLAEQFVPTKEATR